MVAEKINPRSPDTPRPRVLAPAGVLMCLRTLSESCHRAKPPLGPQVLVHLITHLVFSLVSAGSVGKESACNTGNCLQHGRPGFDHWVRKIPWRREWQPTPAFLPGKSYGQRIPGGYSPWNRKESDTTECAHTLASHLLLPPHVSPPLVTPSHL